MWTPTGHPATSTMPEMLFGGRNDGDASLDSPGEPGSDVPGPAVVDSDPGMRRSRLLGRPCSWLRQVHGATVRDVGDGPEGRDGDALVTTRRGHALTVATADCAPVLLWGPTVGDEVVVGACHAGWRGLAAGVVGATCDHMRRRGATQLHAVLGPCISPAAYEFGRAQLASLALQFGPEVVAATGAGAPAFDLRAAVRSAARAAGIEESSIEWMARHEPPCTASDDRFFSWRARRDTGRNLSAVWRSGPSAVSRSERSAVSRSERPVTERGIESDVG